MIAATAVSTRSMVPHPFRIERVIRELSDTFTLDLRCERGPTEFRFAPGQFNMLYVFGIGEAPISISGDPDEPELLIHTVRAVGAVTRAMASLKKGGVVGVRGPFGSAWPVEDAAGADVVLVAGGLGLAPLRPAVCRILANRARYGRFILFYGARTPRNILFRAELERWRARLDTVVEVTVDRAPGDWRGHVGVVTKLVGQSDLDPDHTVAMVCGPETMMRFAIQELANRGVGADRVYLSMERNMKCAIGFCGHCQFGGHFVCRDGPVFRFDRLEDIFKVREL